MARRGWGRCSEGTEPGERYYHSNNHDMFGPDSDLILGGSCLTGGDIGLRRLVGVTESERACGEGEGGCLGPAAGNWVITCFRFWFIDPS